MSLIKREPVAFFGLLQVALLAVVTALTAFEVWSPTDAQLAALTAVYAAVTAIVVAFIRGSVSPTTNG